MNLIKEMLAKGGVAAKPIEYVGGKTYSVVNHGGPTISLTDLTGGLDNQPSEGDIVVVGVSCTSTSIAAQSQVVPGYTEVDTVFVNADNDTNLAVSYKIMGATPDTTITLPPSVGGSRGYSQATTIQVFRNVDITTPIDALAPIAGGATSITVDPPAITPITSGALVLGIGSCTRSAAFSSGDTTNFIYKNLSGGLTTSVTIGSGYIPDWVSGAVNIGSYYNVTAFGDTWGAIAFALKPK